VLDGRVAGPVSRRSTGCAKSNCKIWRGDVHVEKTALLRLGAMAIAAAAFAQEGPVPKGVPKLDHVFVILMENHGYCQVSGHPNNPFVNKLAKSAKSSHNYFAVAHPSLTNYLEIVGGSNFGLHTDNYPNWHNELDSSFLASIMLAIPASRLWPISSRRAKPTATTSSFT
jgi:hypothetical protein